MTDHADIRVLATPLAPDPCIRNVRQLRGGGFFQTRNKLEREAREWRNCPYGCGMTCKGLLPLPGLVARAEAAEKELAKLRAEVSR